MFFLCFKLDDTCELSEIFSMSDQHSVAATLDSDHGTASVDESPSATTSPVAKTKDEAAATVKSVHSNDSSSQQDPEARPWVTTLVRLGPLTGVCGLILAFASIIAALGILLGSRGQSAGGWQPSTCVKPIHLYASERAIDEWLANFQRLMPLCVVQLPCNLHCHCQSSNEVCRCPGCCHRLVV